MDQVVTDVKNDKYSTIGLGPLKDRTVVPVIVTLRSFPQSVILSSWYSEIAEEANRNRAFNNVEVLKEFIIWGCDECELIAGGLEKGASVRRLVEIWKNELKKFVPDLRHELFKLKLLERPSLLGKKMSELKELRLSWVKSRSSSTPKQEQP